MNDSKRSDPQARVPLQCNVAPELYGRFMKKADSKDLKRSEALRDAVECWSAWGDPMDFTADQRRAARALFDMADQEDLKKMDEWQKASAGSVSPANQEGV